MAFVADVYLKISLKNFEIKSLRNINKVWDRTFEGVVMLL